MATNKMVKILKNDLAHLVSNLDESFFGLKLCMIFQKPPAVGPSGWILCIAADALDEMTDLGGLSSILGKLETRCSPETVRAIERVSILHLFDPATEELMSGIEGPDDARLLVGRAVFGRRIGVAHILFLRNFEEVSGSPQFVHA